MITSFTGINVCLLNVFRGVNVLQKTELKKEFERREDHKKKKEREEFEKKKKTEIEKRLEEQKQKVLSSVLLK